MALRHLQRVGQGFERKLFVAEVQDEVEVVEKYPRRGYVIIITSPDVCFDSMTRTTAMTMDDGMTRRGNGRSEFADDDGEVRAHAKCSGWRAFFFPSPLVFLFLRDKIRREARER